MIIAASGRRNRHDALRLQRGSLMDPIILLIVAIVLMVLAWKFLAGLVKTVVLVVILIAAAVFVFGGIG